MEKLDLERLHNVALGYSKGRGVGKTTLIACDIIGVSRLPFYDRKTLFVGNTKVDNLFRNIREVCKATKETFEIINENSIRINNTIIKSIEDFRGCEQSAIYIHEQYGEETK